MADSLQLLVVSDLHHAGTEERKRAGYEERTATNPLQRALLQLYRGNIWLKDPLGHAHMLDRFLERAGEPDLVVANGDYSCDSAFIGVADDAAFESAAFCLTQLRERFGDRLEATFGDHELGKKSLVGNVGGPRVASFHRAVGELKLRPFWTREVGDYLLLGVTSTLIGLDLFLGEAPEEERAEWRVLRAEHLREVDAAFHGLRRGQRVILFCHDPSALPFLARLDSVRGRHDRIEQTVIGHLHSRAVWRTARALSGMPAIPFLGTSVRRMSRALREAREWEPFKVVLCPSLTGIQLLKDGGYLTVELQPEDPQPLRWQLHPLPWSAG